MEDSRVPFRLDSRNNFFHKEENLTMSMVEHCKCFIPGSIQGQTGWGSKQRYLAEGSHSLLEDWTR